MNYRESIRALFEAVISIEIERVEETKRANKAKMRGILDKASEKVRKSAHRYESPEGQVVISKTADILQGLKKGENFGKGTPKASERAAQRGLRKPGAKIGTVPRREVRGVIGNDPATKAKEKQTDRAEMAARNTRQKKYEAEHGPIKIRYVSDRNDRIE